MYFLKKKQTDQDQINQLTNKKAQIPKILSTTSVLLSALSKFVKFLTFHFHQKT